MIFLNQNKMKKRIRIPISFQISLFLVIIAFIPVVVMMSLTTYENQQLEMLESLNVQQGRIAASALASFGVTEENALKILKNMNGNFISRIRILDKNAELLADSALIDISKKTQNETENESAVYSVREQKKQNVGSQDSFIYKLFSFPIRVYRKIMRQPAQSVYETADFYNGKKKFDGEEIKSALRGKYGAATRISGGNQVSVTLYSAIPVKDESGEISGIVLVCRSTYKILQNLYDLRKDLALVYFKSLIAVALIALFFTFRISMPLKKLSLEAGDCADKKGRIFFTNFTGAKRHDEIGELSRSFSNLVERLNKRIQFSQAFSSDISHEFKNPLTAIRSSSELLKCPELSDEERNELSNAVIDEVNHLQMLLTGVRNISKIDSGEEVNYEEIPVVPFLQNVIRRLEKKYADVKKIKIWLKYSVPDDFSVKIPEEYFDRIAENLIDNAASFASTVEVTLSSCSENGFVLTVEDDGKGINPDDISKIFERFYSERDDSQKHCHTGLGLSIVKSITDVLDGEIYAGNSGELGGAKFSVKFSKLK